MNVLKKKKKLVKKHDTMVVVLKYTCDNIGSYSVAFVRIEPKDRAPIKNHRNQNNHPCHSKAIHYYF